MSKQATLVGWVGALAAIAATGSGTLALAKHHHDAPKDRVPMTLRVYDYTHEDHSALLGAEGEATRILAQAGVSARWTDCPTSPTKLNNLTNCQQPWQVNDYILEIIPEPMAALLGKSEDALGSTPACGTAPHCTAYVFYDRVRGMATGTTAAATVLLGRAMAHEIGHLLLGENSHSSTGIMRAAWSARELRLNAGPAMLFTREQSLQMKTRLAERLQFSEAQAKATGLRR